MQNIIYAQEDFYRSQDMPCDYRTYPVVTGHVQPGITGYALRSYNMICADRPRPVITGHILRLQNFSSADNPVYDDRTYPAIGGHFL